MITGPTGAATLSLLSTIPHQPALAEAFRNGPLAVWRHAFEQMWARAEQRGEVRPGLAGSVVAETHQRADGPALAAHRRAGGRGLRRRGARHRRPAAGPRAQLTCPSTERPSRFREGRSVVTGLPAEGAGVALERSDDLVGDPAAVEAAGLRADQLAVDEGPVDPAGVEGDRAAQVLEARASGPRRTSRRRAPAGRRRRRPSRSPRPSTRTTSRRSPRSSTPSATSSRGHVVDRRVAGLADADRAHGVGHDPAAELDDDAPGRSPRPTAAAGSPRPTPARARRGRAGRHGVHRGQSLRCRIFWTTTKVTSRPTAPTVALPAGVCRKRCDGVPAPWP